MKDLKRMASELLDVAYEVEDAVEKEENDRVGENLDTILEIANTMIDMVEKAEVTCPKT